MLETQAHMKIEKAKARDLRRTGWWSRQLDKGRCYYCEAVVERKLATMDHIIPVSRGGRSTKSNIVVCCKDCNNRKKTES